MALLLWTALAPAIAAAADPGEVEDLLRRAVDLRREGKDNAALPLVARAYSLAPTPRTAAQLGLAEMALGYQLDAERHLIEATSAPRDLWVRKHRSILESSLQSVKAAIGEVVVQGTPDGAQVFVNGAHAGQLPVTQPVRLGEGPATVEVRLVGYAPATLSVKVTGARREDVTVHLERLDTPATAATTNTPVTSPPQGGTPITNGAGNTTEPKGAVPGEPTGMPADDPGPNLKGRQNQGALRPMAWVVAGVALVAVGFGGYEALSWRDKQDQFDHLTRPSAADPTRNVAACGTDDPNRGSLPACQTLFNGMKHAQTVAIVSTALGAGLALGSALLFVMSSPGKPETASASSTAFACAPTGSLNGVTCRLTF